MQEAIKVLDAIAEKFQHDFQYDFQLMGAVAIDETGDPLPEKTLESCKRTDAVLLGAIGHPRFDNNPGATVRPEQGLLRLRKELGLFANVRPVRIFEQLKHLSVLKPEQLEGVDMVIYRELTGGIYFGEKNRTQDTASDLCLYHRHEIERIARLAFEAAIQRRGKLCLIDKANVLDSSRLWREVLQSMSTEFPEVILDYMFVDNAAMQMILNPAQFDVIVTSNMFGDIISDEASVLGGSLGLLPSSSAGNLTKLYEPCHGSYPQAAGKNIANPLATILSVEMMLRDFNLLQEADAIQAAAEYVVQQNILTPDLNTENPVTCSELGDAMASRILSM